MAAEDRRKVVSLLLHRILFFQLFLHWNISVRYRFQLVLVYKLCISNRLNLPCLTDEILLAGTLYEPSNSTSIAWLSRAAFLLGLSPSLTATLAESTLPVRVDIRNAWERLCEWDPDQKVKTTMLNRRASLFGSSLDDSEISMDLSFVSKMDVLLHMLTKGIFTPPTLSPYAPWAIDEYTFILQGYYRKSMHNWSHPDRPPPSPELPPTA